MAYGGKTATFEAVVILRDLNAFLAIYSGFILAEDALGTSLLAFRRAEKRGAKNVLG